MSARGGRCIDEGVLDISPADDGEVVVVELGVALLNHRHPQLPRLRARGERGLAAVSVAAHDRELVVHQHVEPAVALEELRAVDAAPAWAQQTRVCGKWRSAT